MKKFLSLFIAVLMVAAVVAMMPVFTVSAAGSTLDTTGLTKIEGEFSVNTGCGFLDGSSKPVDSAYAFKTIVGSGGTKDILSACKVYVDGKQVRFNLAYNGEYYHAGLTGDGIWWGIVGAGFTKDQESTLTVVVDDQYYMEGKFKPSVTAHYVVDQTTTQYTVSKNVVSVVEFETLPNLQVGDAATLRFHDEHDNINAAIVTSIDGNKVTFVASDVTVEHTLCEYTLGDGSKFTVTINEQKDILPGGETATDTVKGYVQVRPNANALFTAYDARILVEANEEYIKSFDLATINFTVTNGGVTKTFSYETDTIYRVINAGKEILTASEGCGYLGVSVSGIPTGVSNVSAELVLTKGGVETKIVLGEATVDNPYGNLADKTEGVPSSGDCIGIESQNVNGTQTNVVCYSGYDAIAKIHKAGGSLVLDVDGVPYLINTVGYYGDSTYWGRLALEFEGFQFIKGETYTFKLYVLDADYNLVYFNDAKTFTSQYGLDLRPQQNVTLPEGLTAVENTKITDVSSDGISPYGTETPDKLFDGKYVNGNHTKLCCGVENRPFTVTFKTNGDTTLTYYTFVTANDTAPSGDRNPEGWVLYGKVGTEWVALSTVAVGSNTGLEGVNYTPFSYKIDNVQTCTEYMFEFTEQGGQFQMAEIILYQ